MFYVDEVTWVPGARAAEFDFRLRSWLRGSARFWRAPGRDSKFRDFRLPFSSFFFTRMQLRIQFQKLFFPLMFEGDAHLVTCHKF